VSNLGKQTPATDPETRLLRLMGRAETSLQRALIAAVVAARDTTSLVELEELILAGRFDEALEAAVAAGSIRLADEATAVFVLAGEDTAALLSDVLEVVVGFDQVNQRAVDVMRGERLRLIREFSAEQRNATRNALVEGIARGANPREQATAFRGSIGLTARQQAAVDNFRRLLSASDREALSRALRDRRFDSTIEGAIDSGEPLTRAQIDRMTARYRERMLKFRAETIARTEALRAVHQGSQEAYHQAIDRGHIDPGELVQTWVTAGDERVRGSHRSMSSQQRPFGEAFISGSGALLRYPGDPSAPASETVQCRCALATRIP
jgi:hypothetical protein